MSIMMLCPVGSFTVEQGPTKDLVEVRAKDAGVLRRVLGRDADIRSDRRGFRCRIGRTVLSNFMVDVYERYA